MITECIKLHFKTPLHIGSGSDEMDRSSLIYHSDALKSALFSVGIATNDDWQNPSSFFEQFRVSSCFPFFGNEFFFPKPYIKINLKFNRTSIDKAAKKAKKVEFISTNIIREWAKNINAELPVNEDHLSPNGAFLFSNNTISEIYKTEVQQRVAVPLEGENENSRPFYLDRVYFSPNAGLYLIARFENPEIRKKIIHALHLLGEQGIGTDRTVGNGIFEFNVETDVQPFLMPGTGVFKKKLNMGLYLPKKGEIDKINLDNSSWNLIKRGGYLAGSSLEKFLSLRKNTIYFFVEGSTFETEEDLVGRYENLRPQFNDENLHPVWRDGQPIFMSL